MEEVKPVLTEKFDSEYQFIKISSTSLIHHNKSELFVESWKLSIETEVKDLNIDCFLADKLVATSRKIITNCAF